MCLRILKEHCRHFGLAASANKATLQARLWEFSEDHETWDRIHPGAHKQHKGTRTTVATSDIHKSKSKKLSMQHLAKLRECTNSNVAKGTGKGAVKCSRDMQTLHEIEAVVPWAQAIMANFPYKSEVEATANSESAITTSNGLGALHTQTDESFTSKIAQQVSTQVIAQLAKTAPATILPHTSHDLHIENPTTTSHSLHSNTIAQANDELHHIKLGDGSTVSFVVNNTPDPVAVTFIQDIPRLNAMWDDTSSHWGGESVLTIEGHPIPIKYWPEVYHYGKTCQWEGTKSCWTDWRDVVDRYCKSSSEATFWTEFSVDGEDMSFTAIVAATARKEYGEEFNAKFSYRKKDKIHVMSDVSGIAHHYKKLKTM
ncbi:hypothetical protein F4604DRAFT_1916555 [Suillus subluteus]|nr:hypothetical protein F4604DRAFT_1916555 [Suillus subluteus]